MAKYQARGVGGGARKDDPKLKARLNAAIGEVLSSGECEAISKKA